jgi:putative ABC transport system permease protein
MLVLNILPISLEQGLAYALVALGIALTFRVLSFPDLTVDGSFPLGGAVAARLIVEGIDPTLSTLAGTLAGFVAGGLTGILNTRLKINSLLAGILIMTILYSVNLRIMGRANIQLLDRPTVFSPMEAMNMNRYIPVILFFLVVIALCKGLTDVFLNTEYGLALQATGDNEQMIRAFGVNTDNATIIGLGLSNALVALSGALVAQDQGFSDVGMGIGMIVAGLASIIIGEAMVKPKTVFRLTLAAIVGSILYRLIIALGLRLGLAPTDLKFATGVMVILALGIPALKGEREGKLKLRGV